MIVGIDFILSWFANTFFMDTYELFVSWMPICLGDVPMMR